MPAAVGTANEQILALTFEDFRGQRLTKRMQILGTLSDASIGALVDAYDSVTNCRIVKAAVELVRPITGTKAAAANALERNESEQMELAFVATDPVSTRTVTKSVIIPALVAAIELTDGSPDPANAALNTFTGLLQTALVFTEANGAVSGPIMTYSPSESHHITVADVVDTI